MNGVIPRASLQSYNRNEHFGGTENLINRQKIYIFKQSRACEDVCLSEGCEGMSHTWQRAAPAGEASEQRCHTSASG